MSSFSNKTHSAAAKKKKERSLERKKNNNDNKKFSFELFSSGQTVGGLLSSFHRR